MLFRSSKALKDLHASGNVSQAGMDKALAAQQKVADEILKILEELRKVSDVSQLINNLRQIQEKLQSTFQPVSFNKDDNGERKAAEEARKAAEKKAVEEKDAAGGKPLKGDENK